MATVSALNVLLNADSATFEKDLGKARQALSSNTAKMNRLLASLDKSFNGVTGSIGRIAKRALSFQSIMGTVAGTAGLGLLIHNSLDTADAIAKTADKIGLSTDALQEYRYAAGLAGVSTGQIDSGLGFFVKTLGQARLGTGELATTVKKMDSAFFGSVTSAESTEKALQLVFEKLGQTSDAANKAALASAFFGRTAGVDMVNLVRGGSAELEGMRKKARDLGLVLDEKLLRGAEKAKDALSTLADVLKTKVTATVLILAPHIDRLASSLLDYVEAQSKLIEGDRLARVGAQIRSLEADIASLARARFRAFESGADDPTLGGYDLLIERRRQQIADLRKELEKPIAITAAPSVGTLLMYNNMPLIPKAKDYDALAALQEKIAAEALRRRQDLDAQIRDEQSTAAQQAKDLALAIETPIEAYNREIQSIKDLRQALDASGQSALLSQDQFDRAAAQAMKRMEDANKATEKASDFAKDMGLSFSSSFEDAIVGGNKLRDVLKGLEQDILRIIVRKSVTEPAGNAFSNLLTQGLGAITGSLIGGGGGAGGSLSFGGPRAGGGPVAAGSAYLVGERGPEIFAPGASGTILPAMPAGGGGGNTYNFAVDLRGASMEAVARLERFVAKVHGSIEKRAVAAVQNARHRDPRLFA